MPSALVERPLVVSPSLAATIGLEGALLYQLLVDWQQMHDSQPQDQLEWHLVDKQRLQSLLPFWDDSAIDKYLRQLQEQGLIIIGAGLMSNARNIRFALPRAKSATSGSERRAATQNSPTIATSATGARPIDNQWRPDRESIEYLTRFQGVSVEFIDSVLPEFVAHWRDSGVARASWNSTFTQHVSKRWKKHRYQQAEEDKTVQIHRDWQPAEDALEILERGGIKRQFIWDAVPEFILIWQERGTFDRNWNKKFVDHVRRQWEYARNNLGGEAEPSRIPDNWQPSADVDDVLRMANIDTAFARQLVPEFVLYWQESKQLQRSWNYKFLQHVKYQWAKRHQLEQYHERQQQAAGSGAEGTAGFIEKHTDRSWRDGL